jgi:hypothetical protein
MYKSSQVLDINKNSYRLNVVMFHFRRLGGEKYQLTKTTVYHTDSQINYVASMNVDPLS